MEKPAQRQYFVRLWHHPPGGRITLNQTPCTALCPQWVGCMGLTVKGPLWPSPCHSTDPSPLGILWSPSLSSRLCGFRHPCLQRKNTPASGHSKNPLNYKLQLPPWHFRLLCQGTGKQEQSPFWTEQLSLDIRKRSPLGTRKNALTPWWCPWRLLVLL